MKKKIMSMATVLVAIISLANTVSAQDVLTGDKRLACEAIVCLSTGSRPGECSKSMARYFGIGRRHWKDVVKARSEFLKLCPRSNESPQMDSLIGAMSQGAGQCTANSLNARLRASIDDMVYIKNQMPDYCSAYTGHQYSNYTNDMLPKYVGLPLRGGRWVEAKDYDQALATYNARIAAEDAAAERDRAYN